jgi:hypothetical protein
MPSSSLFCCEDGSTRITLQDVCCAIAQAIGKLLPLGRGFESKPVHVGFVLVKVTWRQEFHVLIFPVAVISLMFCTHIHV